MIDGMTFCAGKGLDGFRFASDLTFTLPAMHESRQEVVMDVYVRRSDLAVYFRFSGRDAPGKGLYPGWDAGSSRYIYCGPYAGATQAGTMIGDCMRAQAWRGRLPKP